ncbi:MAG: response regulator transcription factor [Gammaproteobacteria bacterium]|nr:response regulator transcription factor [Gammaproteobacteria bacterium]
MLIVYSQSRSFEAHINTVVDGEVNFRSTLTPAVACPGDVYLVHAASFSRELSNWLANACKTGAIIGIADDSPAIENMLAYTEAGVHGYFNAYMAAPHYAQMIRLLKHGQSWFPPSLLSHAFDLARAAIPNVIQIDMLTEREREIALAVAKGMNNKLIADECNISERTVKTHLTHIFKKLDIKDRVSLVVYLKQANM